MRVVTRVVTHPSGGILAPVLRIVTIAGLAVAWLCEVPAGAAPTSKLVYSRSSDAEACPDEQALRREVAARVGYDPFFAWANRTVVAGITRRDGAFVATVDLVDDKGVSHGARELRTEGECRELLDAVALAIAIAIDPQSLSRVTPSPAPPPPAPPAPSQAALESHSKIAPPPPVPPERETESLSRAPASTGRRSGAFEISAGAVASGGVAPTLAAGLALGLGLRWHTFSLSLEGRIDAPAGGSAQGGGEVSSWLVLGGLAPCVHVGPLFGCVLGQAGSAQTSGSGVPGPLSGSAPWWAAGGRVGVLLPANDDLLLRVRTDVVANLDRATLQLNGSGAWTAPPVATSLAADVVLHFQ